MESRFEPDPIFISIHKVYCITSEGCNKGQVCTSARFCKTLFGKIKTNYKAILYGYKILFDSI